MAIRGVVIARKANPEMMKGIMNCALEMFMFSRFIFMGMSVYSPSYSYTWGDYFILFYLFRPSFFHGAPIMGRSFELLKSREKN
jgi:hypothetical protein